MNKTEKNSDVLDIFGQLRNNLGWVYASGGANYQYAFFGRDSLEVIQDLMDMDQQLALEVLLAHARLQGVTNNKITEEEPGRIIHEHRQRMIGDQVIPKSSQNILDWLSNKWGGTSDQVTYYGSVDSTPLFVINAVDYCTKYGVEICNIKYTDKSNNKQYFRHAIEEATRWIIGRLNSSGSGLLEFRRGAESGLLNQSWTDSASAYIFGTPADRKEHFFISAVEVNIYAYSALVKVIQKFSQLQLSIDYDELKSVVNNLEKTFIEHFIDQSSGNVFGAVYRDEQSNEIKPIKNSCSNSFLLFGSQIFGQIPKELQSKVESYLLGALTSSQYLTHAGIRCRSLQDQKLVDFWDYHGSHVTWPKQTKDICTALRNHNLWQLAQYLEQNLMDVLHYTGNYDEFFFLDEQGSAIVNIDEYKLDNQQIIATNHPEKHQAWTLSAAIAISHSTEVPDTNPSDQKYLQIAKQTLSQQLAISPDKYRIAIEDGINKDKIWNPTWWQEVV